jgi:hypothetical protein
MSGDNLDNLARLAASDDDVERARAEFAVLTMDNATARALLTEALVRLGRAAR